MMFEIKENVLTYEIYSKLRESVGWLNFSEEQARNAMNQTYYSLVAEIDGQPIGMARVLGDGLYFLIADVVVSQQFQGNGYGKQMIEKIFKHIESEAVCGSRISVQLLAEKGKEHFYEKFGFKQLPHEHCGPCMRKIIRK